MTKGFTLVQAQGGPGYWQASGLAGVVHGFATRQGGVSQGPFASLNLGYSSGDDASKVQANRLAFQAALGLPEAFATAHQVHGNAVLRACDAGQKADALVSGPGEAPLGVITADCTPVLLWDPTTGAVAAVHAGWRGSAAGVVGASVAKLVEAFGVKPASLRAAIGPHLGPCCFEVGPEVLEAGLAQAGWAEAFRPGEGDRLWLDQGAANQAQLVALGLAPDAVQLLDDCTRCHAERYFSWRRDQGHTGRMLSAIAPGAPTA